jgi:hypothetical protein
VFGTEGPPNGPHAAVIAPVSTQAYGHLLDEWRSEMARDLEAVLGG